MENEKIREIKDIYKVVKERLVSSVDSHLSPDYSNRCSSLIPNKLATVLADTALGSSSVETQQWIEMNVKGKHVFDTPPISLKEFNSFMWTSLLVLEKVCGIPLSPELQERLPSVETIMKQLAYPYYHDTSYLFPFHLACMAFLCTVRGFEVPDLLQKISDQQQPDGSWIDDTTITAMSVIALQQAGVQPKYDFRAWLERARLPDGSWAASNGEVWEASYALRTGLVPNTARLVSVLVECMHSNYWWGFSRYSVPDVDDLSAACYALAHYEPHIVATALTNLQEFQDDDGGWGAFPVIEGIIPHESVVKKARETSSDITCHAVEAFERNRKKGSAFKKGISFLMEAQEKEGYWQTPWWKSEFYVTTETAFLLKRNDYREPSLHALDWLESRLDIPEGLSIVEYALLIGALSSENSEYSDSLIKAVEGFLRIYRSESLVPTFDIIYYTGLLDLEIYRLSIILLSLGVFLGKRQFL